MKNSRPRLERGPFLGLRERGLRKGCFLIACTRSKLTNETIFEKIVISEKHGVNTGGKCEAEIE